ncbi:uncharacterized protein PITG_13465 [Phytophthora infestans T30-4]|uniref:Uncharacterized protein n=1 Tax=Phytophthora infestans (strain T30-4) TaxID=403677 RepID=D0NM27_PHYIT|nr:uncharacterized protein PITG_13465 [Phytophthora infestans T30-4]EEY60748.1 conserved hypothetical protein [Phytophthora infestans T30-4]|eukprot:XP_002899694.1 conserved hypothetical protein [Phytophthora infestans T30-4]
MTRQLIAAIYVAYFEYDISKRDLSVAIAAVMAALKQMRQVEASSMDLQYIYAAKEFRTTYVGTADVDFRNYVAAYCSAYLAHTSEYTAPCITIKQSSGFGKSRILQRLAESTSGGNCLKDAGNQFDAAVLYVCPRSAKEFKGYPRPTEAFNTLSGDEKVLEAATRPSTKQLDSQAVSVSIQQRRCAANPNGMGNMISVAFPFVEIPIFLGERSKPAERSPTNVESGA